MHIAIAAAIIPYPAFASGSGWLASLNVPEPVRGGSGMLAPDGTFRAASLFEGSSPVSVLLVGFGGGAEFGTTGRGSAPEVGEGLGSTTAGSAATAVEGASAEVGVAVAAGTEVGEVTGLLADGAVVLTGVAVAGIDVAGTGVFVGAAAGVLVAGTGVLVAGNGVFVGGTEVLVDVAVVPPVTTIVAAEADS